MNKKKWLMLICLLGLGILLTGACAGSAAGGTSVWIDAPVDGLHFADLRAVQVQGHASSPGGISRVEVWVNGSLLTTVNNPPGEGTLAKFEAAWTPTALGEYTIQAVAFGRDGAASRPDYTRVTFGDVATATVLGCPSPVGGGPTPVYCGPVGCPSPVGGGPTPVNCEPVVRGCPSPVGGGPTPGICPTDTATSPPPPGKVVQFLADPPTIEAGACTTLRWHVENVQKVIFGGIEQPFDGSYKECLCASQRYTLTVVNQDGVEEKHRVEIAVSGSCITPEPAIEPEPPTEPPAPPDTTPPSVPSLMVPADGLSIGCKAEQTLAWLPVDDPSGIAKYGVQVQRHAGDNNWQPAPGGDQAVTGKSTTIPVECGWYYRWRVIAVDGAGNESGWSGWFSFAVPLT